MVHAVTGASHYLFVGTLLLLTMLIMGELRDSEGSGFLHIEHCRYSTR